MSLHLAAKKSRKKALAELLQPIIWDWRSSVESRQNLVTKRHMDVILVYPFLMPAERKKAEEWYKTEDHEGLWD